MKKLIDLITLEMEAAFEAVGYGKELAKVTLSNRPDLCEFQCNGAMAGAKLYKKAPIMIANEVVEKLGGNPCIKKIEAVPPGFINIELSDAYVSDYVNDMINSDRLGVEKRSEEETILLDYGGANVAKPLHVGHLRTAIIGESVKRIARFMGHKVVSDVHLGDWGLQMGLIIVEVKERQPNLPYFDDSYKGEYPEEAPFTIGELEEIYPTASGKSKSDEAFKEAAMEATFALQKGHRGYRALWNHILAVSVKDLKKNYGTLGVDFDLWKGESDAEPYIDELVTLLKNKGLAKIDQGALVVEVQEDTDTKEVPPCMILKSDGASLYGTTDLATLIEREKEYQPKKVVYIVDKRQELHFEQVFRVAKKAEIIPGNTELIFLGFGTMNGKDGKPFKTRDGGVMRLEQFIGDICEGMYCKIMENREMPEEEARKIANMVGISAIKYGDLSNQASKDYVFDIERFTSFEGNTGPYILYSIVRIKSILNKYKESGNTVEKGNILAPEKKSEKQLMLELSKFNSVLEIALEELAPHKICAYIYDVSNAFNHFYHETKILAEENVERKESYISLLEATKTVLLQCIELLGFEAPDKM